MTELTDCSKPQIFTSSKMHDIPAFKSANEFSMYIENIAAERRISHLDAVLQFCANHFIDPDEISSKINKSLKEKIANDFRELNYLPKQAQLDV